MTKCPHCKKDIKYSNDVIEHPLINKGKPAKLPGWTYGKHKQVVKQLAQIEKQNKELTKTDKDEIYNTLAIMQSIPQIDPMFTEEILDTFHPNDRAELFLAVYYAGKKGVRKADKDFRKSTQTQEKQVSKK